MLNLGIVVLSNGARPVNHGDSFPYYPLDTGPRIGDPLLFKGVRPN